MKNSLRLIVAALLSCLDAFGQSVTNSKVVDEQGNGIPFASVGIIRQGFGTVTFEDGTFALNENQKFAGDTLIVSAIGFKKQFIPYAEFLKEKPQSIILKEEVTYLDEVVVALEKLSFRELGSPKKSSPNHLGVSTPLDGATVAYRVDDITEPVLIDEIATTIRQLNMDSIQVRCRIFAVDPETNMPGEDLLKENLVVTATEKQQRLVFQLSKNLWLDQPFYVGFEWVMTKNQFEKLEKAKAAFPLDFVDEIVAKNPGYDYNINQNKRIQFRDPEGNVVKKVNLTKEQIALLNEKDAASPKLQFKIKMKGTQTYTGSPITGRWSKNGHEALVSIKVGKRKNPIGKVEEPDQPQVVVFGDKEISIDALEAFVDQEMVKWSLPGMSFVIFNKDKVLYHDVRGQANIGDDLPVTKQTIFEGASLSKPLFAYFVMKYVEAGLLDLDKPLYEYLPYEDIAHDVRYKKITARMVLSHTTGFPNWRSDYEGELFLSFDPGSGYQYSGEGFQYLAKVLAHLLNTNDQGLEEAYQDKVAQPLGLKSTKFLQDQNNLSNKALPYKKGEEVEIRYKNDTFGAAFSVHSEAKDFSIWLRALLNEDGLKQESFEELFTNQIEIEVDEESLNGASGWTLGFAKYDVGDKVYYGHGGNNYGYTSGFFIDREKELGAVIFTNADQVSEFVIDTFLFLLEY